MALDLYDSVNWGAIPADANMVAGYVNGWYAWPQAAWDRFTKAKVKLRITVTASENAGHVLDCETGDATPGQCPGWIKMRQASGLVKPCIYCNLSTMPAVQLACSGLNYCLWIAWYTGDDSTIVAGASAVQYADPAKGSGGDWDATCIADMTWPYQVWGATGPPTPAPAPPPPLPIAPPGNSRSAMYAFHPTIQGRVDMVLLDPTSHIEGAAGFAYAVIHAWSANNGSTWAQEQWGVGVGYLVPGTESISWSNWGNIVIAGVGADGGAWACGGTIEGPNASHASWVKWCPGPYAVSQVPGPVGPPGPTYDDTTVKSAILTTDTKAQQALDSLGSIKAAIK